jgi:DNA-binding response OmpR family regulator
MNIVIIDDSPDTAEMLRMLFEAQGHSVLVAFSGIIGMELACVAEPDLLIVDIGLPDIDGVEVIRSLRSICKPGKCCFVVYTGRGDSETRRRAEQAGAEHFYIKSHDIGGLLALIDQRAT